tara:strand:+ start:8102 stop:9025 length:924 start_codon:yes stop_codon:yes gene_type:complete
MTMTFKTPMGWENYANSVLSKTRLLINQGIWDDIDELSLNRWLTNFKTPESKYLSACMLDALSYRSKKMCHSMMRKIIMDVVPNYCREEKINNFDSIKDWLDNLTVADPLVRFVPVSISDGRVKSSAVVAREFIQANDIQQRLVQQPENIQRAIDNGTKLIVFLDDFAGSGFQFLKFVEQQNLLQFKGKVKFIYVPLAGHIDSIERIHKTCDFIKIIPIEVLSKYQNFFYECEEGFFRGDKTNSVQTAKDYYKSFCGNIFDNGKYLFGMSAQCLTYSFFFSCPNNNLKALYHEQGADWRRLIFRGRS